MFNYSPAPEGKGHGLYVLHFKMYFNKSPVHIVQVNNLNQCAEKALPLPLSVVLKCVCVCMTWGKGLICHSMHMEVRGKLGEVISLGPRTQIPRFLWQASLATEPPCRSLPLGNCLPSTAILFPRIEWSYFWRTRGRTLEFVT